MTTSVKNENLVEFTSEQIADILAGKSNRSLVTIYRRYDRDGEYLDLNEQTKGRVYLVTKTKVFVINHLEINENSPAEIWRNFKALYVFCAILQKALQDLKREGVRMNVIPRKATLKMNYAGNVVFNSAEYADFTELPLTLSKANLDECKNRKEVKQLGFTFARGLFSALPLTAKVNKELEAK